MRNLKNNKVAGTDGIHLELIKYGVLNTLNRIYELVRQIWEEERMPEEWKETIIVPIYKKGDGDMCENYRGITLGNTAYKILANIILEKIKPYNEKINGDYQNGLRDGRSVIDNIILLKIINEKFLEYNQNVQYLLTDFQKALYTRDMLWKCMEEIKIPKKLINMCHTWVQKTNRWQDEVREGGRLVCGKGWEESVCNRDEWKKLLRRARNHHILHMPME